MAMAQAVKSSGNRLKEQIGRVENAEEHEIQPITTASFSDPDQGGVHYREVLCTVDLALGFDAKMNAEEMASAVAESLQLIEALPQKTIRYGLFKIDHSRNETFSVIHSFQDVQEQERVVERLFSVDLEEGDATGWSQLRRSLENEFQPGVAVLFLGDSPLSMDFVREIRNMKLTGLVKVVPVTMSPERSRNFGNLAALSGGIQHVIEKNSIARLFSEIGCTD